ncbi:MAG: hypothetical protein ABI400_05590 [Lacisediminihabitans sp.]
MASEVLVERVDWLDPRAVTLREAMDLEMNALYSPPSTACPPSSSAGSTSREN